MKHLIRTTFLLTIMLLFSINEAKAQEITKYDYLEVIVFQKMDNSGKIKRIEVEDQESPKGKSITIKANREFKSNLGFNKLHE